MSRINHKYSPEFKIEVIEDKLNNHLGYRETAVKYHLVIKVNGYEYPAHNRIKDWERIYLEKGKEGFYEERRGRGNLNKTRKVKLDSKLEEDLIAENQRLRMEIEYLKKLSALVSARERNEKKSLK